MIVGMDFGQRVGASVYLGTCNNWMPFGVCHGFTCSVINQQSVPSLLGHAMFIWVNMYFFIEPTVE